jgi:ABC-type sugar transport system substrate-binding protein
VSRAGGDGLDATNEEDKVRRTRFALLCAALLAIVLTVAACGSDDDGGAAAGDGAGGGGDSKSLVVFMPPTTDTYLAEWVKGFKAQAQKYGYEAKILENNFDQAEMDVQVQQTLGGGNLPDMFVWWPVDNAAGQASLRQLYQSGKPVLMANQLPLPESEESITFYAGVDDVLNGRVSGELMIEARDELKKKKDLKSEGGNVIVLKFPAGYSAGADRMKGFNEAIQGSGIEVIGEIDAGFDETKGRQFGADLITSTKSKGIDLVYAENDALASGAIQALEDAGFKPGEDVMVIGGTCHGNLSDLQSGKQYGTGLQAALLEGQFVVDTAKKYFDSGEKVEGDKFEAEATPDAAPAAEGAPAKFNFIPNPPVRSDEVDSAKLWGKTMKELCTY